MNLPVDLEDRLKAIEGRLHGLEDAYANLPGRVRDPRHGQVIVEPEPVEPAKPKDKDRKK